MPWLVKISASVNSMLMKVGNAIEALFGEYFYDFSEQNTNGFTGARAGEDVISDYLVGAGVTPSSNYFISEAISPGVNTTVTKVEVSFYTPVQINPDVTTDYIRLTLFENKDANGWYIILGGVIGAVSNEIIGFSTGTSIWYILSSDVANIPIGHHDIIVEWNSGAARYDFTFNGNTYAGTKYSTGVDTFIVNSTQFNIMRRFDGTTSIPNANGAYTKSVKFYDASGNIVLDFLNKYGANGTTYNWNGFNFTRVVGDATKRVTTSVPSQYRIENSSKNKKPAMFDNALQFDGVDDYVSFSTIPTNTNYSFSAWIYTGSSWVPNSYKMIAGSITSNGYIGFRNASGFIQLAIFNCEFRNTNTTSIIANTNTWYHLVLTKTGSVSKAYINGVFQSNGLVNAFPIDLIGKYNSGLNLNGRLDEIAIWHTELTPTEVSNLYNSGSGDFATNYQAADLIAYWRMNGTSGDTIAIDEQGTYNGTLNGFDTDNCWVRHGYYKELAPFTGIAASFDGSSSKISLPNSSTKLVSGGTLMCEVYINNISNNKMLLWNSGNSGFMVSGISYGGTVNRLSAHVYNSGGTMYTLSANDDIVIGKHYSLAMTYDGAIFKFYVNGILQDSTTLNISLGYASNSYIGGLGVAGFEANANIINAIRIDDLLNDTKISQLITRPELTKNYLVNTVGIDWANVAAFYPLTEGGGDIAYDLSDNKNHGTWTNPAWVNGLSTGRQLGLQNVSRYYNSDAITGRIQLVTVGTYIADMEADELHTFTIRFTYPSASPAEQQVCQVHFSGYGGSRAFIIHCNSGIIVFNTRLGAGAVDQNYDTNGVFPFFSEGDLIEVVITLDPITETYTSVTCNGKAMSTPATYGGRYDSGSGVQSNLYIRENLGYPYNGLILELLMEFNNRSDIHYKGIDLISDGDGAASLTIVDTLETITLPEVGFGSKYIKSRVDSKGVQMSSVYQIQACGTGFTQPFVAVFRFTHNWAKTIEAQGTSIVAGVIEDSTIVTNSPGLQASPSSIVFLLTGAGKYNHANLIGNLNINETELNTLLVYVDGTNVYLKLNNSTYEASPTILTGTRYLQFDLFGISVAASTGVGDHFGVIKSAEIFLGTPEQADIDYVFENNYNVASERAGTTLTKDFAYYNKGSVGASEAASTLGGRTLSAPNGIEPSIEDFDLLEDAPYDTFLLECNSQNIIVTDGEVEETFALRGEGDNLRYDGHAGSFTNIKQIQLWFNPLDNTDIEYLMTDEENNRILYLEGNQIKSDFGLAGVMVADVETDIILNNVNNLISIEFYGALTFEEIVIGSDFVGTPGTFGEFTFDKLNIFKAQFTSLLEQFDYLFDAAFTDVETGEFTTLYNAGTNKLVKEVGLVGTPEIVQDGSFNNQKYFLLASLEQFKFDNPINNFNDFTFVYVSYFGAANHYFSSSEGNSLVVLTGQESIYIYPIPSGFSNVNNIYTSLTNDIFIVRCTNNLSGGTFDILTASGNRASRSLANRMKYMNTFNISTNSLKTPFLGVISRSITDEEVNSLGQELATKYGITWTDI